MRQPIMISMCDKSGIMCKPWAENANNKKVEDLTGSVFGRLTVIRYAGNQTAGRPRRKWLCRCECGSEKIIIGEQLKSGKTSSCGCYCREQISKANKKHGLRQIPEYRVWAAIIQRCNNENCSRYPDYGGRGISICERWLRFENFIADMGLRPSPKHTIDRMDNDGNYEPANCKWATDQEQRRNRRTNRWVEYNGERKIVADWAKELGVSKEILGSHLNRKSFEECIKLFKK